MAKKKVDDVIKSDAQKLIDYNYPEEHFVADKGGTFTDLGNPFDYRNPHR